MTGVRLSEVSLVFGDGTVAVSDVSLDVADGEFVVLLGPSGCGKSSILRMVAGLQRPTRGSVVLDGPRTDVAMVFQDFALYPHLTVASNIGFPLEIAGVPAASRMERIAEVASALGIGDLLARRPGELSGGQRQRVAMGRALVRRPRLLLMDEPLSNLDTVLRSGLRAEIVRMARSLGLTMLYVTHDQIEAQTMADRIAVLRDGVLEDSGRPAEVYRHPATMHVAAFLGSPRMSLFKAYVHVVVDSHVGLHIGGQVLELPFTDMRARAIAHYDGEDIAVGARAEALVPVAPGTPGHVLTGQVGHVEHHGHETLVSVDVGAWPVELPEARPPRVPVQPRGLVDRLRSIFPAPAAEVFVEGRHQVRHSELVVRVSPDVRPALGEPVGVRFRLDRLHFFDLSDGRRIGPKTRR
ncbi:sugar ABC transporter ATP-binding protein [Lentzea sp. NBRC 105346]|uniref:ABC transporter ATP-binding protein n=1 Tax=Lentzea sp. NBRC 105346 TaxID=3032205 RepID=UPI00249FA566|nr:ABC transporter ATP-binding protein [Lentzea sp. NBRC 105346]GLZ31804.1 sugar ABC transporter ATP-binding protein [Lentzea sp. NBRC 105346]